MLPRLPPKPMEQLIAEVKARRVLVTAMAARMVERDEPLRGSDGDEWVLIAPDTLDPTRWRMTRFEGDEPCNHVGPTSPVEAIMTALDYVSIESLTPYRSI